MRDKFPLTEALALWHEYVADWEFRVLENQDAVLKPNFPNFIKWLNSIKYNDN